MDPNKHPALGALVQPDGVLFRTWAPEADRVEMVLGPEPDGAPLPLEAQEGGYHQRFVPGCSAGSLYRFRIDGGDWLPDPASRYQPQGVHGPSQVVDPNSHAWRDHQWQGIAQKNLVFYELHVGTFTSEGTFQAVEQRLPYLRDLGITAIELMPLADFPGRWNWGYDVAALYAPCRAYGQPDDLRSLVDAAHQVGLAVFLDVIYNHFGPDGSYIAAFAPVYTEKHHTPWGKAINLDDQYSRGVRRLFIDNALHWLREYHLDGLRLDATHTLRDDSETHFLAELADAVQQLSERRRYILAEDERNLRTLVQPRADGGYGLDAVWADDFHHQVRSLTAGDRESYYADFADTTTADLATTLRQGWFYTGQHSVHLDQPRGTDPQGIPLDRFVFCIQNHDQIGNRPTGQRLNHQIPLSLYRAVSAVLLFAPELPLLFMGQEWATSSPFLYFTDHHDELGRLVSEGRRKEFQGFRGFQGEVPDPQAPSTFQQSRLDWSETEQPDHAGILRLYRDLLALRQRLPTATEITAGGPHTLTVRRGTTLLLVSLADDQSLSCPAASRPLFDTEQGDYAIDGHSPYQEGEQVVFPRPAAAVYALPEDRAEQNHPAQGDTIR